MTLDDLIKRGIVEKIKTNPDEVRALFKIIQRDIETAEANLNINVDWAHNIAYNAMIQACIALSLAYGYRSGGEGKHFKAIEFAKAVAGPELQGALNRLNSIRRVRNKSIYQLSGIVSEQSAKDTIEFAKKLTPEIEDIVEKILIYGENQ